jgi:hypothetical protein
MSRLSVFLGATAVVALTLAPILPSIDTHGFGAAFAKNDKGNGGNGNGGNGGNGNGNGGNGKGKGSGKGTSANGKSPDASKASTKSAAKKPSKAAKADAVDASLAPRELGKMNGALNASINAITAHIRNGQTTNGPVGLMAGLAIADAAAAEVAETTGAVLGLDLAHDALSAALVDAGYVDAEGNPDLAGYLGTADVPEEVSGPISDAIAAVGGLNEDGSFVTPAPTEDEVAVAVAAAAEAEADVTAAEDALLGAWNKDGDADALLGMARERLGLYGDEIAAAIAETETEPETVPPEDEAAMGTDAEAAPPLVVPTGG